MKLSGRGEFQIIDYLRERCQHAPQLEKGIGDDCAVVEIPAGEHLLTTTDLLTDSVHFRLDWTDLFCLGRKSVSVNVSDLAAMGATPRFLFLSLAIPDDLDLASLEKFFDGFLLACTEYDVVLVGGDTCRSNAGLTISVSAQGTAPAGAWVPRGGAAHGDDIYVTGTVGDSALALQLLLAGQQPDPFLLQRHINPAARVATGLGLAAAAIPTAMIDISDGLLGDLEHILEQSGVGAVIETLSLPLSKEFERCMEKERQMMVLALAGGEDYELLFTALPGRDKEIDEVAQTTGVSICKIGKIVSQETGLVLSRGGEPIDLPKFKGYKHFPEKA